jgi:SAM-dependent methyltransferase
MLDVSAPSPAPAGPPAPPRSQALRLFEISVLALFLEVLLIRWVPAQVRVIAYFTNYVLVACFFGLGLGMLLARRRGPGLSLTALLLLLLLVLTQALTHSRLTPGNEGMYYLNYEQPGPDVPVWFCLLLIYAVTAAVFLPVGQEMGRLFDRFPPLIAYSLNIGGSLVGTLLMPAMSWIEFPPAAWTALAGLLLVHLAWPGGRGWAALVPAALCVGLVQVAASDALWSPYQKVKIRPLYYSDRVGPVWPWVAEKIGPSAALLPTLPPDYGFNITVNDDYFQSPTDLSPRGLARFPALAIMRDQYEIPYQFGPLEDVLIVGAGSGNDVAAALRRGARRVDAVEIDPLLLRLGRQRHPEKPYSDPRVTAICQDARSYFKNTDRKYDLVVFGLLDSHMLASRMSSVRLDSYVYTVDSLKEVRRLLKPQGLVVLMHASGYERWSTKRLFYMMADAFDRLPYLYSQFHHHIMGTILISGPGLDRVEHRLVEFQEGRAGEPVPTDDWPFFYMQHHSVPFNYIVLLAVTFTLSAGAQAATGTLGRVELPFFFLGAAFMLLETRSVTAAALFFGSTWMVSAVVIVGILVMILLANWTALSLRLPSLDLLFAVLGLTVAANAWLPVGLLDQVPAPLRPWAQVFWLCLPLYAAGLVFARAFAAAGDRPRALGSNLLGGVAGGFLEYASLASGYTALLWLALALYAAAWLSGRPGSSPGSLPARGLQVPGPGSGR